MVADSHLIFHRDLCGHVCVNPRVLIISLKLINHIVSLLVHNVNDVYVNIKYAAIDSDESEVMHMKQNIYD